MPLAPRARLNARVVVRASSMRQALSRAAFSRSSRPMRPSRWERVTATSGHSSRTNRRRFFFAGGVQRREDRGDRDRADPGVADPPGGRAHATGVERDERAAVELVTALQHHDLAAHQGREVLRPVDERGQRGAGGQADAHRGDAAEVAPLHHGIGEVGRADHGGVGVARGGRLLDERGEGARDARRHVRGRGRLHRGRDRVLLEEHGVGVGAAHVDADPSSHANETERKSRS